MSIELANDSKQLLGQVASNKGYSDLIAAADKQGKTPVNLPLIVFFERGFTTAVTGCIAGLKALAGADGVDSDVAKTAKNLAKMMDGESFVILTDGTSDTGRKKR